MYEVSICTYSTWVLLSRSHDLFISGQTPREIEQMSLPQHVLKLFVYLLIFINDICRDAFVNHFGEDGWGWGAILLAGLLCQPHLVTFGAQGSLTHDTEEENKSSELISAANNTCQNNPWVAKWTEPLGGGALQASHSHHQGSKQDSCYLLQLSKVKCSWKREQDRLYVEQLPRLDKHGAND